VKGLRFSVVGVAAVLALTGCGSSSSKSAATSAPTTVAPTTTTQDPAAAKAAITAAWEGFFNGATPTATKLADLQDGAALAPAYQSFAALAAKSTANVKSITLLGDPDCSGAGLSAPCANVTYDLLSSGTVALPGATGFAVYISGQWVVSKVTFCTLAALGNANKAPAQCS
jgi:hypothetical protein